ncbi:MAG: PKD-like family lipoprotein [Prevotella sp.]|nr:PKD-like family lipoprotein [Prevotella sp.]MDY5289617.1 PKD-like family lipoprotein [Prevotella sp.]
MKKTYFYILGLMTMALVQSCYEDKGNYDYHAVNELKVEIPEVKVRMPKEEPVMVTLTPELTQTLAQNEDNLTFEWKRLKDDENAKLGSTLLADYYDYATGKVCNVEVEAGNPESIGMLLVISDKVTGQKWYQLGKVAVVKPLNPAWFILQENEAQHGIIGAVEGDANGFFAYSDVFKSETGESFSLEGKPLAIAANGHYGFSSFGGTYFANLTIATDKNIATYSPSTLQMMYGTNKIMFENAKNNVPVNLSYYKMDKKGEMFVTDKKAYFAYDDGWCVPYSVYDLQENADGEVEQAIFLPTRFASFGTSVLAFNKDTHRFRIGSAFSGMTDYIMTSFYKSQYYRKGAPWTDAKPLVFRDLSEDAEGNYAFDPSHVDASLDVCDILRGGDNGNNAYAIMAAEGASELTIFRFSKGDDPLCAGKYTVALPNTVDLKTARFAASQAFSAHFVFMASGNSIYRIDMERQKIEPIYTYEADGNAKIACLKFRDMLDDENGNGMILGFAVNTSDGKGLLGELQLTVAGDVERAENAAFIFSDPQNTFGKIVDISYNYE